MTDAAIAVAEARADPRIGDVSEEEIAGEVLELLGVAWSGEVSEDVDTARRARTIEWASQQRTQGEILDDFATYCRDELDDVDVLEQSPVRLELGWRRERSTIELRAGPLFWNRLVTDDPLLLLAPIPEPLAARFVEDEALRTRLAAIDLERLEKINAVRSSVFVHFEWFLRDVYGVKLIPSGAFTRGLVERGIISLGMG